MLSVFAKRHPVWTVVIAVFLLVLVIQQWAFFVILTVIAGTAWGCYLLVRKRHAQTAALARRDAAIDARADYQDKLLIEGDLRGFYGKAPPVVPGSAGLCEGTTSPDREQMLSAEDATGVGKRDRHGEKATGAGELEHRIASERAEASKQAKRKADDATIIAHKAGKGRALIDEFVELMRRQQVPSETIFEESRGPVSWTYDTVVGDGWMLQDRARGRSPRVGYYYYILPGLGIAKVVRRLPDKKMINVLCYLTRPDNSDRAYSKWADRESQLAYQAQQLIDRARATIAARVNESGS